MILRIREWDKNFENAGSRKLKRLEWVAIPNKTDGEGYTALVDHPDAAAHLGAWYAIVEAASKQDPRGNLPGGIPHTIGGICRSLGRMSRLPSEIFQHVIPRLLEIGWLEWIQQDSDSLAESASTLAESADIVAAHNRTKQDKTKQDKDTHTTVAPALASDVIVRERADRFHEFIAPWPRVANPDHAARCYLSCIDTDTDADEARAFAARDRYLASDEVARGVITDPAKWLMDQKAAKWGGKWPAARAPTGSTESTIERAAAKMLQRALDGGRP